MFDSKYKYKPYVMWLFPALFFAYQFILRLWPGLMMHQIMEQFSIDASQFGMLAAFYYYGYAGMQIPVAILLDRFGAKLILFIFTMICGLATLMFIYTESFWLAVISRFLIGAGSAVGFLGVSKVVSQWFPKDQYARMISFSFTIGLMGAIYGGKPVNMMIEAYSWQQVALALAAVSMALGLGALLMLREPKTAIDSTEPFRWNSLRGLLTSPVIWTLALANLLMVGALEGFADVWGVQYLMTAYEITKGDAAGLVSFVFFGMLFGGPLLATLANRGGEYPVLAMAGLGMALAFALLFLNVSYNWWLLVGLFFAVGLLCCYQVIVFAAGSNLVAPQNLGVTVAFLNCINMLGGSFFHTSIGKIMDLFWTGSLDADGLRLYDLQTYQYALSIVPLCALFGAVLIYVVANMVRRPTTVTI
jgi:predicted MFS family arabinose efflux permease